MSQYSTLGYIPAPATIFQTVRKLSPGFILSWMPDSGLVVEQYWNLETSDVNYNRSKRETRYQLRGTLKDAARSHLVSDVPMGVFFSGRIDSSTMVALMSEVSAEPVKRFSIGRILRETQFEDLFIHPAPGDSGGAVGAALYVWHVLLKKPPKFVLEHAYLGQGFNGGEIKSFLSSNGFHYKAYDDDEILFNHLV